MRAPFFVALVIASSLMLSGCGKIKKTKECKAFIDQVNTSLKEIEKHTSTKAGDDDAKAVADMEKLGQLYDKLGADVAALDISTPELKKHATDYQTMAKKAATTARSVAEAIKTKDLQKATSAQSEFDGIVKQEDKLVKDINTFCTNI